MTHPGTCPTCKGTYADLVDHIRKVHPHVSYTTAELQPLGLVPCPDCGCACNGAHGVRTHRAKIHGIKGASRVSTLPRAKTKAPDAPFLGDFPPLPLASPSPASSPIPPPASLVSRPPLLGLRASRHAEGDLPRASLSRKRAARTPSPGPERPPTRPRVRSSAAIHAAARAAAHALWGCSLDLEDAPPPTPRGAPSSPASSAPASPVVPVLAEEDVS